MIIEEYAHETNPIYKCPGCNWVFSPSVDVPALMQRIEELEGQIEVKQDG